MMAGGPTVSWLSRATSDNPLEMLWHYANGRMPDWHNGHDGEVVWIKRAHRGVQWLDKIHLPSKAQHRKYILEPKFSIRCNTAFEQVVRACADLAREGKTWITADLARAYCKLHELGFAHCFEAWDGDKLVAGAFGVQMGAILSIDSVFHTASNAGMAVYGQALLRLRDRGFKLVDVNYVSGPFARFGEEWVPQWRFEQELRSLMHLPVQWSDDRPAPELPKSIRMMLGPARVIEKVTSKFRNPYQPSTAHPNPTDTAAAA